MASGRHYDPDQDAFGHISMLTVASDKLSLDRDIDQLAAVTAVALLHARLEQQEAEPTASDDVELTARQALASNDRPKADR